MKTTLFFLVLLTGSISVAGQIDKFGSPGYFQDKHTVYEFKKSNWDGTHSSRIFLYVADSDKLESFKWWEGESVATLVSAMIDWTNFSVTQFENYTLKKGERPEFIARLNQVQDRKLKIEVKGMKDSLLVADLPWHSYDFDLASLSFIWRALKNKQDVFWFHIADVAVIDNQPKFVNKGKVTVEFTGYEIVNKKECLKYSADGPGLDNKGGFIWIDPVSFMIEQYKIALPDEPGFNDGMLQLVKSYKMKPQQWNDFKRNKLGE